MAKNQAPRKCCSCAMSELEEDLTGAKNNNADKQTTAKMDERITASSGATGLKESQDKPKACVLVNLVAPQTQTHEIIVLALSAVMLALGLIIDPAYPMNVIVLLIPYAICGWPVIKTAGQHILRKKFFNEFTLMSGATIAAIALGQLAEALAVMLFYRTGEFFQEKAAQRSRGSIKALLASKPNMAQVVENGQTQATLVEYIKPGATVLVPAGEIVPLDGIVQNGRAQVDTSPITGEFVPRSVGPGDALLAGYICLDAHLTMQTTASFQDTQLAKVLQLVEEASARKSKVERFITRLAAVYTPVVFAIAVLVALAPPLLQMGDFNTWIYRALVLLVISCPCALVISIPLGYFAGIGAAARQGILVKGGHVLDALSQVKAVAFDKTGTLTQGKFQVSGVFPVAGVDEQQLLYSAMLAQAGSNHPLAKAIRCGNINLPDISHITSQEIAGQGVMAQHAGHTYLAGSLAYLQGQQISNVVANNAPGSVVYVAVDGQFQGSIVVNDSIRPNSQQTISQLKAMGLKTYMLSGDREQGAAWVAQASGLDGFRAGLLPAQKVEALDELVGLDQAMFVGDGINDAPILAASRVSLAMGGVGSAAAIESADAVVLNDDPAKVVTLLKLGASTRAIIWQNIVAALGIKAIIMTLGVLGLAGLWEAVFADAGVALLAVLNATRMLPRTKN